MLGCVEFRAINYEGYCVLKELEIKALKRSISVKMSHWTGATSKFSGIMFSMPA